MGLDPGGNEPRSWAAYQGDLNDVALGVSAPAGTDLALNGAEILTELASMVVGFGPTVTLAPGESTSWTRLWGVAPDLATLSAAFAEARDEPTQAVEGQVTAPDGPVAGARVVIDVDGAPYTIAVTDPDGRFAAAVPPGEVALLAEGRGTGRSVDLPPGAAAGSAYAAAPVQARFLAALTDGAVPVPLAEGRGVGTPEAPLSLQTPATLAVDSGDGLPFTVRVRFVDPDPPQDPLRVTPRPDGLAAAAWARDGAVEVPVEPGTYDVLVHRGPRYELHEERVTLAPGARAEVHADLPPAFAHPGWVLGDPHSHASPSSDGALPMEDRLVVTGAVGVQVHFGTDHDHVADYRPLLAPLGLQDVVHSVVADEVSPPVRGHFNVYPVEPVPEASNHGAWLWWDDIPESTEAVVDRLRARHGDDFLLQTNHPTDNGMAAAAGWSPGEVSRPDKWTSRFQVAEVLNSGDWTSFLPFWEDVISRGMTVTPVGVSDSHSHFGGHVGWSATWLHVDTDDAAAVSDDAIAAAIRTGTVVPMRGPFLDVSPLPGATVPPGTAVDVTVRSASWVRVDRLHLLRDGVEVEVVDGTTGHFVLEPDADAWYAVVADGDTPMQPVTNDTPWALAGPWRVDVGGDGWTPPLPPFDLSR
ncbi:MAG: CehA/McbA family metallohydrolase [Myxococcota bacterium]